jgi:hypothetical protein
MPRQPAPLVIYHEFLGHVWFVRSVRLVDVLTAKEGANMRTGDAHHVLVTSLGSSKEGLSLSLVQQTNEAEDNAGCCARTAADDMKRHEQ